MNNENNAKTVSIQQDSDSSSATLDATLSNNKKRLVPDSYVDLADLTPGTYDLDLVGILNTGTKDFKLSFRNAKRPNGEDYFEDTVTAPNYVNSVTIKVS